MNLYCTPEALAQITVDIPDLEYFPYFAHMAERARAILEPKTPEQIYECAGALCFMMMLTLRDMDHEEALLDVREGREADVYVTESSQMSEVRALKLSLHNRLGDVAPLTAILLLEGMDTTWHQAELFAVLTLLLLAEAIKMYDLSTDDLLQHLSKAQQEAFRKMLDSLADVDREVEMTVIALRAAAAFALKAMESVNYAEHLLREHDRANDERDARSRRAEELQQHRHGNGRKIVEETLREWDARRKGPRYLVNADANGRELADWLQEKKVNRSPRVVAGWIRDYAKSIGLKLR